MTNHGPRLNRYYEKLKPYYRIDKDKLEEPKEDNLEMKQIQLPADKTL